jgi:hypothetical protein
MSSYRYHDKYKTKDANCSAKPPIQIRNVTNLKLAILNYLFRINNIHLSCQHLKKYSCFIIFRLF